MGRATTRYAVAPSVSAASAALAASAGCVASHPTRCEPVPPATFRLVRTPKDAPPPALGAPPPPQVAVLPRGVAQTAGGAVDVAKLGPSAFRPWFAAGLRIGLAPTLWG